MKTKRKRPRINRRLCDRVLTLAAEGYSERFIASEVGVARATVAKIRLGYRGRDEEPEVVPYRRCAGCGKLVNVSPCVVCAAVSYLEGGAA